MSEQQLAGEVREVLHARGITLPGVLSETPIFGDLIWTPAPDLECLMPEPAVVIETEERLLALHRRGAYIKYFAGPNSHRPDAASESSELGLLPSVEEAVELAAAFFLGGEPLEAILVPREVISVRPAKALAD